MRRSPRPPAFAAAFAAALCVWLCAVGAAEAAEAPTDRIVAGAAQRIFAASGARGMAISVVRGDEVLFGGYGETRAGGPAPNERSLVSLGALSNLLASDVLVALTVEGRLRLSDPLQIYVPGRYAVPQVDPKRPITLLHLATHTSGLPRDAAGPLWEWLPTLEGLPVPGQTAIASNAGYTLLLDVMQNATGHPYDQILAERLLDPLEMRDTTAAPTLDQCRRYMDGARDRKTLLSCADRRPAACADGLYSTPADMTAWMRWQLGSGQHAPGVRRLLAQAMYVGAESIALDATLAPGEAPIGLGMGWIYLAPRETRPTILMRADADEDRMTLIAIAPGTGVGIFIAASGSDEAALARMVDDTGALIARLSARDAS